MKSKHNLFVVCAVLVAHTLYAQNDSIRRSESYPFRNPRLSFEKRADDLVKRLTLQEKINWMQNNSSATQRLGIPGYNWWNECLHGVARDGVATVFPQAIGMAATWDPVLIRSVADVISTEARAKHQEHVRKGERGIYQGLDMWTPNINIFRDPRWGRGQETYGEDPFLTSRIGVAFVKGLQGDDPKYFKVISTAKHYAVHSGSEFNRHIFNAVVSKADLYDTYLPAFETLVKEAKVYSVMGAYNSVYGVPACASAFLLDTVLRKQWGFDGYVVSDCGAISDIYRNHHYTSSQAEGSAVAVKAGCDLSCGTEYRALEEAVSKGLITEDELNVSVKRLMLALLKLGLFDNENTVAYQRIPYSENDSPAHGALSKKTALESMVLLQNKSRILPLENKYRTIAVIGPFANDREVLEGNYSGTPSHPVPFLQGITQKFGHAVKIIHSDYLLKPDMNYAGEQSMKDSINQTVKSVAAADLVIFCGGLSPRVEGEESRMEKKGFFKGDRLDMNLPDDQSAALKALKAAGKKVILVLTNGSSLALNWENKNMDAIVETWYPGQEGGSALADILTGDYNPAGRLPVTFYQSLNDLPEFEDYSMNNRTYKYFSGKPLYPFGYGLSYSDFQFDHLKLSKSEASASDSITVSVDVKNVSKREGDEVVQIYVSAIDIPAFRPVKTLVGFSRVHLKAGETKRVNVDISVNAFRQYNESRNEYTVWPGKYRIMACKSSEKAQKSLMLTVK